LILLRHKLTPQTASTATNTQPKAKAATQEDPPTLFVKDPTTVNIIRNLEQQYTIPDPYYWQFHILVLESAGPPPSYLYMDDESVGRCLRIGMLVDYEGMRTALNTDDVDKARKSLSGVHNLLSNDRDYLKLMPLLPSCDIYLKIAT
jgi:hypothetical protein